RGALAILVVHAPESEAAPFSKTMRWARRTFSRSSSSLGGGKPTFPMLYLEDSARDFLLRTGALTDLPETGPARGLTARFRFAATREIETARNVVAIFPGSDPERAGEVIVYSAHYDHIGVNDQGEVFNGADDNGSGTCALLEVAEAFAEGARPPRSVAFLWVSGEEKGLLGSRWFVEHSPLGEKYEIVADINLDMVGRNEAAKVSATPSPKHKDYSTLNVSLGRAAEAEGYELLYNADQYYGRTDSYNFAKQRIPSMFLFTGEHKDYHRPSDTFEKIDLEKAAAIARIAYRTGWRAASSESRPEYIEAAEEMPQVAGEEAGEQRTRVFF
ncbi:MAG: M20/M25/M40 family metallo-hydrolase, partial [Planctomycetota bacterium]